MSWVPKIGDLSNEYSGSHGNVVDLLLRRCMFCSVSRMSHGWDRQNQLGFYGYVQIVRGCGFWRRVMTWSSYKIALRASKRCVVFKFQVCDAFHPDAVSSDISQFLFMHENGSSRRNYGPIISLIDNILVLGEIQGPDDHNGWIFGVLSHLLPGYTKVDSYSMKQENDKDDKREEEHNLRLWVIGATRQQMQSICFLFLFRARSTLIGRVSSNQFFNGLHPPLITISLRIKDCVHLRISLCFPMFFVQVVASTVVPFYHIVPLYHVFLLFVP